MARATSGRRKGRREGRTAMPRPTPPEEAQPLAGTADGDPGAATPSLSRPRRQIARPQAAAPRARGRFYRLTHPRPVMNIIEELRKVVWPSRHETSNLTAVVLIVAIAVGIFLGAIDWGLNRVVENVILP